MRSFARILLRAVGLGIPGFNCMEMMFDLMVLAFPVPRVTFFLMHSPTMLISSVEGEVLIMPQHLLGSMRTGDTTSSSRDQRRAPGGEQS